MHANRYKVKIHKLNVHFTHLRQRQCFKIHLVLRFFRILAVCSRATTNQCNKHGLSWYYCVCNHTPAANPLPLSCFFFFYTEFKATLPSTQLPRGKMKNQFVVRDILDWKNVFKSHSLIRNNLEVIYFALNVVFVYNFDLNISCHPLWNLFKTFCMHKS